jgi:hypothetical protein
MLIPLLVSTLLAAPTMPTPAEVAAAHGREAVPADHVFEANLTVRFRGNVLLDEADLRFHPNGGLVRIETETGVAVFDGTTAWVTGEDVMPRPRFQLLTWPYFAVNAFKLDDGGTSLEPMEPAPLVEGEQSFRRAMLTFGTGVGDSPDDWYILYFDDDDRLVASAYIVTYGAGDDAPEPEPHAIVYGDFIDVPADGEATGVLLSPDWTFYNWDEDRGIVGEPIGTVSLSELRLVAGGEDFVRPQGSTEVVVPGS